GGGRWGGRRLGEEIFGLGTGRRIGHAAAGARLPFFSECSATGRSAASADWRNGLDVPKADRSSTIERAYHVISGCGPLGNACSHSGNGDSKRKENSAPAASGGFAGALRRGQQS